MAIDLRDFAPSGEAAAATSARFDAERAFLFTGLEPRFATRIVRSVFLPMRDGTRLSTDFHIPLGAPLPLPVVLVRTPYDKRQAPTAMPALLPEQGFVYAIQDVRGRYESEGEFVACSGIDRDDGFDTIDWIARQTWCNGRIATLGSSYTGETAAKAAATRHPAHRCCVIMFDGSYGGGATRNGAYLQGGVSLLRMMFTWYRDWVPAVSYGPPPHVDREAWFQHGFGERYASQPVSQPPVPAGHLLTLPVDTLLDRIGSAPSEFAAQMRASADPCGAYFARQGFMTEADRIATPSLFLTGPLERGGSGFDDFALFKRIAATAEARDNQHLWITPAVHSGYALCGEDSSIGERRFGDTRFPYYRRLIDWFGHWLRDDTLDPSDWPAVRYFLGGRNQWQVAPDWPPPQLRTASLYLDAENRLGWEPPNGASRGNFTYDPADPTPSEPDGADIDILGGGYADRRSIEARADVLTFTSAPLDRPLTLAGPVVAELWVSSDTPDTDIAVVLSEVDAAGRSVNITHGIARLRYRRGLDQPALLTPGEVYPIAVDLWHVAREIPSGHALRIAISSSHFPFFDRNLNTGLDNFTQMQWRIATNTIHAGAATPSAVRLPVLVP